MEYRAKIFSEFQLYSLWKYEFLDIQTSQIDYFYHHFPIGYDPNIVGKLSLTEDKFFVSFEKEIKKTLWEIFKSEILTGLTGETEKTIENVFTHLPRRKIKLSLEVEHLHRLHNRGYKWKQVANIYEKHEQTIYYWLRTKDKVLQKRGAKPRIDSKTASLIRDYALKNNTKTQQEIADYIFKEFNVPISRPSICVLLKKLKITRKRLTFHYNQLDKEKAKEFNEEIKTLLDKTNFIAIDECSFYPNLDPRFGYSLKGERAVSRRPSSQGKHYTLLFAISNLKENGVIHWKLVEGSVDWKVFYDFLEEINPIGGKRNILMMDNARIHIAFRKRREASLPTVKEQMLKKNTEVWFIPSYAPMLNPVELCFNLLRQQTEKQRPRNYEEMKSAIEKVVKLLNSKDLGKYFWHCAEYFDEKDAKINLLETIKKL